MAFKELTLTYILNRLNLNMFSPKNIKVKIFGKLLGIKVWDLRVRFELVM